MRDPAIEANLAGCASGDRPAEVGKNMQVAFVTLGTVNRGKKNFVDKPLGTQSTLTLLPVYET
jgi:hypothetical protein